MPPSIGFSLSLRAPKRFSGSGLTNKIEVASGAHTIYGHPIAIKYGNKLYIGTIRADASRSQRVISWDISTLTAEAQIIRTSTQDDDHNNAFITIRPDQGQIIAVANDHSDGASNLVSFFRSTSLDVTSLPGTPTFTHTGTAPTYAYLYVNPADLDQLDVIVRYGASSEYNWRLLRSENLDGAPPTVTEYPLFINHYIKTCMANDGSGLWIAATHEPEGQYLGPAASRPVLCPRLALWFLNWSTDEISSGGVVEGTLTTPFVQINGQCVNQITYTNNFGDAAWTKERVSTSTSTLSNRWGATNVSIQKLVDNATNNTHRFSQVVTCDVGQRYEMSGYFKKGVGELSRVLIYGPVGSMASHGTDTSDPQLWANLNDGTRFNPTNNLDHWEITAVGNDWYRVGAVFTATNTVAGGRFYIFLVNDSGATLYAGTSTGLYADSAQYGATPYTNRLMPFCQNITTSVKSTTAPPLVVYDPPGEKLIRLLAFKDVGPVVAFLFAEFDDYNGVKASDPARNARILYREVNKTTWALSDIIDFSASKMDGADDDISTGSFTYLGGDIIGRWDVIFDQQNYNNSGKSRIIRRKSPNGKSFSLETLVTSVYPNQVMRPIAIQEVTFDGSNLRHQVSDWISWMEGPYDGYSAARGGFDTTVNFGKITV